MVVARKPHQILVFEHLLYFLVGSVFLLLCLAFGAQIVLKLTALPPEEVGIITAKTALALALFICHLLMPYSCLRLWISAGGNSTGTKKVVWRIYAASLFIFLTYCGIKFLIIAPRIFEAFRATT